MLGENLLQDSHENTVLLLKVRGRRTGPCCNSALAKYYKQKYIPFGQGRRPLRLYAVKIQFHRQKTITLVVCCSIL